MSTISFLSQQSREHAITIGTKPAVQYRGLCHHSAHKQIVHNNYSDVTMNATASQIAAFR